MQTIKKYFFFVGLGLFTLIMIVINVINGNKLDDDGVYVLGKITDAEFSARGTMYKYEYYYDESKYKGKTTDVGWGKEKNDLFFLRVLPKNPSIGEIVYKEVPYCFGLNSVPSKGWKKLPLDSCKY